MPKGKPVNRNPGIMPGFDKDHLRKHVVAADQKRELTQDELARQYADDPDVADLATEFPASINDIIDGVCEQDHRFVDSGKKLLRRLLAEAASVRRGAQGERRHRAGSKRERASAVVATEPVSLTSAAASKASSRENAASKQFTESQLQTMLDDFGNAEIYGG